MGAIVAGTELVTGGGFGDGGLVGTAPVGTGIGGVIATVALIYVLAYLDLFEAADYDVEGLRATLVGAAVPLAIVFVVIVLYETVNIVVETI